MDIENKQNLVLLISQLVQLLSEDEKTKVLTLIAGVKTKNIGLEIPVSIFRNNLSGLEAIVYYLKELQHKSILEIAELLNRKNSTIYVTYAKAKKKIKRKLDTSDNLTIPLDIFSNRKFAVLESIVYYLKTERKLSFKEIALALNKSYSTITTVNNRYLKKCQN